MARAKKEAALTPEERLQAALVPDWEWPYKLPGNWCWVKLVESFDNHTDSKKKIKQKDYLVKGRLAVVDQGQELIGGYTNDVEKSFSGTLPVVIFGDHTRCIKFVDFPFAQGADGVKVLRPKPFYLPKAFYYALQSVNIPNLGYRRHFPLFNKFSIPLPPFAEQQRIVDRIESLFAKLDEAKEKAQAVVDSFETRKAAILHKAFTGELTAKWREEHGVGMESWEVRTLDAKGTPVYDEMQLDYETNLLACCDGGKQERSGGAIRKEDLFCESLKGNTILPVNPLCVECENKFLFSDDGEVIGVSKDAEVTIKILNLNSPVIKNMRKYAIDNYALYPITDWQAELDRLANKDSDGQYEEFCFVLKQYIETFHASELRQVATV